ncbi:ALP1-like protein [Tanacetum coccineum]
MNLNDEDGNFSDISDESDIFFLTHAYEYHQASQQQEAQSSRTRNPIYRDRDAAEARLLAYFGDNPKYMEYYFRRRYCMSRKLFLEIVKVAQDEKHRLFKRWKEGARKDDERAFGVLQER